MKYLCLLSLRSIKANKLRSFIKTIIIIFCVTMVTITSGLCSVLIELEKQTVLYSLPDGLSPDKILSEINSAWNVKAMQALHMFFTTLVLAIASLTIYSVFYTDIRQQSKLMAVLMTVGATDFQKNFVVIAEGLTLAVIGIPLSILLSIPIIYKIAIALESILRSPDLPIDSLFRLDAQTLLKMICLAFLVIIFSSVISILRVRKISIVKLAKSASGIEVSLKKSLLDFLMWKIFGKAGELASANYINQKRNYRHLSFSFSIAMSLYVGGSVLIPYFLQLGDPDIADAQKAMQIIAILDTAIQTIPLLAMLNSVCLFITSFNARKHEFAIYQSVGMDLKMMYKMIVLEWVYRGFYLFLYGMIGAYGLNFAIYSCFSANGIATQIINPFHQIINSFILIFILCTIMTVTTVKQLHKTNIAKALKQNF